MNVDIVERVESKLGTSPFDDDVRIICCELRAAREVCEAARNAVAITSHSKFDCTIEKFVIKCGCWQREVAEAIAKLDEARQK